MIKEISGEELIANKDNYQLLDVRSKEEYDLGHLYGAKNINYTDILDHLDEIDKDKPVALYCRTNQRSQYAALMLHQAGYEDISFAPGVELHSYDLVK